MLDQLRPDPLGPDLQLFYGRDAEGIRGGEDDLVPALPFESLGQFSDGGRLPRTVHSQD